jgi:ATP-dependent helicase HrpA
MRSLAHLIKKKGHDDFLRLKPDDLLQAEPDAEELARYPVEIELGEARLKADYRFDPGAEEDGITVAVPADSAHRVRPEDADWLVPGLLEEKIAALLKSLPKTYRRRLAPVSDTAALIAREMPRAREALPAALGDFIHRRFQVDIPAAAWEANVLPDHLKMRFALTGPDGQTLAAGRDAALLQQATPAGPRSAIPAKLRRRWEREGLTSWDCGDLPDGIAVEPDQTGGQQLFPALVAPKSGHSGVALRLFTNRQEALRAHGQGVAALLEMALAGDLRHLKRQLRLPVDLAAKVRLPGGAKALEKQLYDRVVRDRLVSDLRTAAAFEKHVRTAKTEIISDGQRLLAAVAPVLNALDEARETLFGLERQAGGRGALADFLLARRDDLHKLVPDHFVALYDRERLPHLARYLQAVALRAQRAVQQFERDRPKADEIARFEKILQRMLAALSPRTSARKRAALEDFFWLIEEYKVSLFAQELKTAVPVSAKRLEKLAGEIGRMV